MAGLRRSASISLMLGLVSLAAVLMSHLALTDIGHGEGDLTLEWRVLQISFGAILLFHLAAMITLFRLYRYGKSKQGDTQRSSEPTEP